MTSQPQLSSQVVDREVFVQAEPATVFEFFTDPDKMVRWMGEAAELEPRPGGLFRVNVEGDHVARGSYVEVDPPRRLVFTWGWEGEDAPVAPGESTVEVTLAAEPGGTRVRLVHRDLATDELVRLHAAGWEKYVPRLPGAVAG